MDAGRSRAGTLVMSSMQLEFCIDAPSNVRYHELINYRRRYGRPWQKNIEYYNLLNFYVFLFIIFEKKKKNLYKKCFFSFHK